MSVHDAEPMDVYVDATGKLWRVVGIVREPTVMVEKIETQHPEERAPARRSGGVSGQMWQGFVRIYRPGVPL